MNTILLILVGIIAIFMAILGSFCLAVGLRLLTYKDRYPIMTKECMVFNEKENRIEIRYGVSNDAVRKNFS